MSLEDMQRRVTDAAEGIPAELSFKPMFGGICGYLDGRVFASLSDVGLALKIAAPEQDESLALKGAERLRYEPSAPASKQYIVTPPGMLAAVFAAWVKRSADYVLSLPAPKPEVKK